MEAVRSLTLKVIGAIAATAALIVSIALGGPEPTWRPLAPAPTPRQEVSYAALGGYAYLAGGNDRAQQRYDPATDDWTSVADLPAAFTGIDHFQGVAVGGRIVYAGGLSEWEFPFPVTGAVSIYDPISNTFTAGSEMPSPRAAGGVAAWHGMVIYAGGLGPNGALARVDAYDPQTDEWTQLADMPRPREHFQIAIVGDELYAIGGRNTFESVGGGLEIDEIAAVDVLDLPAEASGLPAATWRSNVTSLPTPRGGLGVAAVGQCVYAIGGESGSAGVTGVTESYDTGSATWRELPPLSTPRHGIQAAVIGTTIYIAGGGTQAFAHAPTAAHEALDVSGIEPCVGLVGASSSPVGSASPPRIEHLAVRPRRVHLRSGPPRRRGATIVLVLSHPGRVILRLPGRFHFSRRLRAGRNSLPLPVRAHGRLLPRGRYRLLAKPRVPGGAGRIAGARFRVVG